MNPSSAHYPLSSPDAADASASIAQQLRRHLQQYFSAHDGTVPPANLHADMLALFEKPLLEETLRYTRGNRIKAARMLGINRNTLYKKIREHHIVASAVSGMNKNRHDQ